MIFGAVALAVGAAMSLAFGGALLAGALTTAAFAMVAGTIFWVGLVLSVVRSQHACGGLHGILGAP